MGNNVDVLSIVVALIALCTATQVLLSLGLFACLWFKQSEVHFTLYFPEDMEEDDDEDNDEFPSRSL